VPPASNFELWISAPLLCLHTQHGHDPNFKAERATGHHAKPKSGPLRAVTRGAEDLRVFENREVEAYGLFDVVVEPEERSYFFAWDF
jgi:hypothetical protein